MLTPSQARDVLAAYAAAVTGHNRAGWSAGAKELVTLDGRSWLLFDANARAYLYTSGAPVSGTRGWLGSGLNEPSGFVAAITSLHADGRIRQRATEALVALPGGLAASALAVRALDHVPEVRQAALRGLAAHTNLEETTAALSVLVAGRDRQHATVAFAVYVNALLGVHDLAVLLPQLRQSSDRGVRRWAVQTSHTMELLSSDDLVSLVATDPDQLVRSWTARWLADTASSEQLRGLLAARRIDGRLLALTHLDDAALSTDELLPLLADNSARVRETARWRARRRDIDLLNWYRQALERPQAHPGWLAAALDGLAAVGAASNADAAVAFLEHASPAVRATAITTSAALLPIADIPALLLPKLLDPSPRVAAAAARACSRAGVSDDQAEEAWSSSQPWSRRAAWRLTRASGGWDRVLADFRAAQDEDALLAGLGRAGVRNWLQTAAATTWRRPTAEQLECLADGLDQAGLSRQEQRVLAFHSGLPFHDEPTPERGAAAEPEPSWAQRLLRRRRAT